MDSSPGRSAPRPVRALYQARQAIQEAEGLDELWALVVQELCDRLDAERAGLALLDPVTSEVLLYTAHSTSEPAPMVHLLSGRGLIRWTITNGESVAVEDVPSDARFCPAADDLGGVEPHNLLCVPLWDGSQVAGALVGLNKRHGHFDTDDRIFLEAFAPVVTLAIAKARQRQQAQQRHRQAEVKRRAWEALTAPRGLDELLEVILDQTAHLIEYRSACILLVTEQGALEVRATRGIDDPQEFARLVRPLGLDTKVLTMVETRRPLLIADTYADPRFRQLTGFTYIRSWIGAPLLVKGHLIGTLNVHHDQAGFYREEHRHLMADLAHQAAVAIENSRLYATTQKAMLQLAQQARRMVSLYEASRTLLGGLRLDPGALSQLVERITELVDARYGALYILGANGSPSVRAWVAPHGTELDPQDWRVLESSLQDLFSVEREVVRNGELAEMLDAGDLLSDVTRQSSLGVAIRARDRMMGWLLLAGKKDEGGFLQSDEALALALVANITGAVENALLYDQSRQQLRELNALYKITRAITTAKDMSETFSYVAKQVAELLDVERCAIFVHYDGQLEYQPPGYGVPPDIIPRLRFALPENGRLRAIVEAPEPVVSNAVMAEPALSRFRSLLEKLEIRRMLSFSIPIDEGHTGLLVAVDKRNGEPFGEQDRHLISIVGHQLCTTLQRAALQARQREEAQIQAALLQVSRAISSLSNLDQLLQTVAEITHRLVGCDHCLLAAWDEREMAFVPRAHSGLDPMLANRLTQINLTPNELPFIAQATEDQIPILLGRDGKSSDMPKWMRGLLGVESSLIVPLVIQERVVGLIAAAFARESTSPGESEIALVTGIARQAAIAIENANLYQDLHLHASTLEKAYSALKELDDRKTEFIQNVSHELRTPLTLVKGYLELLGSEEMGYLTEQQREALAIVSQKTENLSQLIFDIVSIQSVDADTLELYEFDISLLLRTVLTNQSLDPTRFQLVFDVPADLPPVMADPGQIERVVQLLMDNAVKFSPDGGQITWRARIQGDMMRIELEDQGIGIPASAQPYVFDLFYQADGSTTRHFGGMGLGLSAVKQIVTAHGGDVGVESVEGQGSTFCFSLPLSQSAQS
jgi:GAF domain-containing protein